jgi:hypothetical protein
MRTAASGDNAREENCIIHAKTAQAGHDGTAREKNPL